MVDRLPRHGTRTLALASLTLVSACMSAALLGGCSKSTTDGSMLAPFSYQRQEDPTTIFDVAGPVAIDVETFAGDVEIEAKAKHAGQIRVTITREARHGWGRKDEAEASLDQIGSSVELGMGAMAPGDAGQGGGELGQTLIVRTWTDHAEAHFNRAHVKIELPAAEGVRIKTTRGQVIVMGAAGGIDIETGGGGDVRLVTTEPLTRSVTIVNQGGSIDYRVQGQSSGAILGQSVRGQVDMRATEGAVKIHDGTSATTLVATLNDGKNPVQLRTVDGHVRIAVVDDPYEFGDKIFKP
jgi:hypothetical protein